MALSGNKFCIYMRRLMVSFAFLFLFCFQTVVAEGQVKADSYIGEGASVNATLYRAPVVIFERMSYEGTFYIYETEFYTGELFYNGIYYNDVLINLDAGKDQLYIKQKDVSLPLLLNKSLVEWFTLDGKLFVNIGPQSSAGNMEEGFCQVIWNGEKKILKKRVKLLEKLGYHEIEQNKVRRYRAVERYWLIDGEKSRQVGRCSDIIKMYKARKGELKEFVRENGLKGLEKRDKDEAFGLLMEFVEK